MSRPVPKAVLFDMDGVLVDSFGAWVASVQEVALRFGAGPVTREDVARIWGQGIEADAATLYPGRTATEIRAAYDAAFPRHVADVDLNPAAHAVLGGLGRRGIRRAVVTNTQTSLAEAVLGAKGILALVDVVAALGEGRREKPAPDLLRFALARLDIPPSEALMVGDTRYDEEAARAAGVAFLRYDFARGEDLLAALRPHVGGTGDGA